MNIKPNEGPIDRIIRAIAGAVLLIIGIFLVQGTLGIVLDVIGVILLITAATGFCAIYALFGFDTVGEGQ